MENEIQELNHMMYGLLVEHEDSMVARLDPDHGCPWSPV